MPHMQLALACTIVMNDVCLCMRRADVRTLHRILVREVHLSQQLLRLMLLLQTVAQNLLMSPLLRHSRQSCTS